MPANNPNNPREWDDYVEQEEKKEAAVEPQFGETFTKEQVDQMFGPEDQQTGNGDELVSVIGPDNLPKVVPASMVAPGTQVATPQQPVNTTVANQPGTTVVSGDDATQREIADGPEGGMSQSGTTDVTDQDKMTATNNTGQQGQVTTQETKQPKDAATQTTDQQQQVTTPKTHMYNWGGEGVTLYDVLHGDGKDKPISQVVNDYYAWAGENGITPNVLDIMEAMKDKDVSKSTVQNELDEKKRKNKEKWDKVVLFLTHLGNAIGTVAGGGHAPLKLEDPVKWTERQRKLREATLAQRNAYNKSYLDMMYKQSADQRKADLEKQRQDREDAKLQISREKADAYIQAQRTKANGDEARAAFYDTKAYLLEQGYPLDEAIKKAKLAETEARTRLTNTKASNVGKTGGKSGGSTVTTSEKITEKEDGSKTKTTTTTTKTTGGNAGGTSRRGQSKPISTGVNWKTKK